MLKIYRNDRDYTSVSTFDQTRSRDTFSTRHDHNRILRVDNGTDLATKPTQEAINSKLQFHPPIQLLRDP